MLTNTKIKEKIKEVVEDSTGLSDAQWEIKYSEGITYMDVLMDVIALVQKETQEQTEKRYSRLIKAIDEAAAEWHDIHTSREGCPFCERGALGKQLQKLVPSIQENVKDKSEEVLATSEVTQGKEKA